MRSLSLHCLLVVASFSLAQAPAPEGMRPAAADGRTLNLDFESGTLADWHAEGKAFAGQPVKGDTVHPRRADSYSRHQGQYWIGGYEKLADKPQGTLTSVAFKVTQPWASFLVGGGPHATTCVEVVRGDTKDIVYRASGLEEEDMRRVVVDVKAHVGKQIFIRLVDRHSGHWGHINFDDFRFHAEQPSFPPRKQLAAADTYKFAGLTPDKAARAMTVPEGFEVKLCAGEPDVVQPIAMCLDDRGRVWIAEAYCYPIRRNPQDAKDRILIFEDVDGDGRFDKRTIFMEGLNLVSGLEVGFGGVWIGAAPHLLYVPMKDDRPAGEPKVLLDGWGWQDTHETLNSFIWGPDGWLYGCHGVFTHSRVGKPGMPDAERVPINAGVWRYHPTRHVFEVFAHGTSNPWGLDFNDQGQAFVEACVIPHCFHIIHNARYHRQAGQHFNPYTYDDIKTIADHFHYLGATPHSGNNRSDSAGGGHAHCGLMCYLGGAWPQQYRGQLFMGNIHGKRINMDVLTPKGSGYVAAHGPDFLMANDAWARFINMRYGPDGNVYLIDWYDKQACHHRDAKVWDRSNGRIYKICYRDTKPVQVDLAAKSNLELAELQLHENDWYVRHARRLLQERRPRDDTARARLAEIAMGHKDATRRLRGLWALHAIEALTPDVVESALKDRDDYMRGWAIQLTLDGPGGLIGSERLVEMAGRDGSPVVRRYLASALPKLQPDEREALLANLLGWDEDARDQNLPLLYWYGLEPLIGMQQHHANALQLGIEGRIPTVRSLTLRRQPALDVAVPVLARTREAETQLSILQALNQAFKHPGGPREAQMMRDRMSAFPEAVKAWTKTFDELSKSSNAQVRNEVLALAVLLGDLRASEQMYRVLADPKADASIRQSALATLLSVKGPNIVPVLHKLVADPALRSAALRELAAYDDPKTPAVIVASYKALNLAERRDALSTLASRPAYAQALLEAVAAKQVPAADVSPDILRQLRNLRDMDVNRRIAEVWGTVNDTPVDRLKLIASYRRLLNNPTGTAPDLALGRAIFAKTCQQCHMLFGEGGKVGPDITGANRGDLKYLLDNILDASAFIPKEYGATVIELTSGRVVTGIVKGDTPAALTVLTANETLTIPTSEIAERRLLPTSMMPDDLLKNLSETEVRALIAYLQSPTQVALPPDLKK